MKKHKRKECIELSDSQLYFLVGLVSLFIAGWCWLLFFIA